MAGLPVIIRLIDPPLHEFLPKYETLLVQVTKLTLARGNPDVLQRGARSDDDQAFLEEVKRAGDGDLGRGIEALLPRKQVLLDAVAASRETNPMLGLRGCRLGIMFPEITEMQVRAIFEAACQLAKEGLDVKPEVMIPLAGHVNELKVEREALEREARKVMEREGVRVNYKFGTMIEIPRAALTADEIAKHAEFFSFGTNDLTQTTLGYSRDDAEGKFLLDYVERGILPHNPFQTLDREGVGALMRMCVQKGRKVRKDLEVGICGEHGGDPASIELCHEIGLDYVSCSPFRVPVARLSAAHAKLRIESVNDFFARRFTDPTIAIGALVVAPIAEEAAKGLGVQAGRPETQALLDGLVYGAAAGLGFSATENLLYGVEALVNPNGGASASLLVIAIRSFSSSFLHASSTAVLGYGIAKTWLTHRTWAFLPFYIIAVIMHATFNVLTSLGQLYGTKYGEVGETIGFAAAAGFALVAITIVRLKLAGARRAPAR